MSLTPTSEFRPEADWPRDDFPRRRRRLRLRTIVKWSLCLLVFAFVGERAYDLWQENSDAAIHVDAAWLALSGLVYLVAWLPSVWVWRELLHAVGESVSFANTARAYYCGHLGKYVPGKLLVPVIRGRLLQERGAHFVACALTAVYETLLMMGAGLAIGLALLPFTGWPAWLSGLATYRVLLPLLVAAGCVLILPLISKLLTFLAMVAVVPEFRATRPVRIPPRLIATSLAAFIFTWVLQGLSLGVTLRAAGAESFEWSQWPAWTGAMAISTSVGFLVLFAPGGLGVREGLLMEVLLQIQPPIGDKQVIAAVFLTRLVSFFAEITAAAGLYYLIRSRREGESGRGGVRETKGADQVLDPNPGAPGEN